MVYKCVSGYPVIILSWEKYITIKLNNYLTKIITQAHN